ncbi:tripartite tricarboxylate transporter substrate binding protein [Elioraea sp.]|uniref:Bug family tripartite tricarboxylate transporter substrate binding protein n=1 Tax=Elioraea sp. TaxID=2185103 RepID=UPI0025C3B334|nr:tripartite tricarboxylate transporter substrate binding protein [Elioraea sp.]
MRRIVIALALSFGLAPAAQAEWPEQPVRIVVPAAPGGPTDIAARLLGQYLAPRLGQPVVIENRPGAGGNIGTQAVASAAPDGYMLLMASFSNAANPALFDRLPYDTRRDLVAVSQVTHVPVILTVPASSPARTLAELVTLAKSGTLTYATGGVGTSSHLIAELFNRAVGITVPAAHYRGAAPANQDLVAGRVSYLFDNPQTALPLLAADRTRALAVTTAARLPELPDVPTLSETVQPGLVVTSWHGIMARAGTPERVLARLARDIAAATNDPQAAARWKELGVAPVGSSPQDFGAFFEAELDRWARVVREANIKVE